MSPTATTIDNQRHNRVRQLILRIAAPTYPHPIDSELIRATLATLGYPMDARDLCYYLAYLTERGYLRMEEKKDYSIRLVWITVAGIDVMDGRTKDCSIGCGDIGA